MQIKEVNVMKANINKLKAAMKSNKVSNAQIAIKTGVTQQWVSNVIRGKADSYSIKQAIAEAVKMPYEELWHDDKKAA